MRNLKKIIIAVFVIAIGVGVLTGMRYFNSDPLEHVSLNQLKDFKIYVNYVNSKRISFDVFFPIYDYKVEDSPTYTLQEKGEGGSWNTLFSVKDKGCGPRTMSIPDMSVEEDAWNYEDVGFASLEYDFIQDYQCLETGDYRVIFPLKVNGRKEYFEIPFEISGGYLYEIEPEEYEYTAATYSPLDFVEEYEMCKDYITYDAFVNGFQNMLFSRDLFEHMTKIIIISEDGSREIQEADEMHDFYEYFAMASLSRSDGGIGGATYFYNLDRDTFWNNTLNVPRNMGKSDQTRTVNFFFDYEGQEKSISCEISGHKLIVRTRDFDFDEDMSEQLPLHELMPVDHGEERTMEYYVFNEIEEVLINYQKK